MSKVVLLGSCRVTNAGVVVAGSNSGIVNGIVHNGNGDDTVTVDPEIPADATVSIAIEGAVAGLYCVTRLTTATFQVLLFDAGGVALVAAYALTIYGLQEG